MNSPFDQKPVIRTDEILLSGRKIDILRLDLIHPEISGNKWFKLKYNIQQARDSGVSRILTFGGAFSNHIAAVAAAGQISRISTVGIIRGEDTSEDNPTLKKAVKHGMELQFISRQDYRKRDNLGFIEYMHQLHGQFHLVPEGGSNDLGVLGAKEIFIHFIKSYDLAACAVGSGGTLAGLIRNETDTQFIGFPVLKGAEYLQPEIERLYDGKSGAKWNLNHDFHFGGYAKITTELIDFIRWFYSEYSIKLDPIYTGKLFFGINELIKKGELDHYENILVIHSGGLQGIKGIEESKGIVLFSGE